MPCGKVRESFDARNAGRRKPMGKEDWYECPKCGSISDDGTFPCSIHWTETLNVLSLTPREVVDRVWPDWPKIRTRRPSKFDGLLEEVRRERAVASARKEQEHKAVPA